MTLAALEYLVLEPEPHARLLLRQLLRHLGVWKLNQARSVAAARQSIKLNRPDILIGSDSVGDPAFFDLVRMIRAGRCGEDQALRILYVVSAPTRERAMAIRAASVDEAAVRPLSVKALQTKLSALADNRRVYLDAQGRPTG